MLPLIFRMKLGRIFFRVVAGVVCLGALRAESVFRYRNPISAGIDPRGIRDCQVFRDGGRWYLTGTAYPVWPKEDKFGELNPGVVLYSSEDLLTWKFEKVLVRPNPERWYFQRFWAPEVRRIDGRYYATFNCRNDLLGDNVLRIGYAVADALTGRYRPIPEALTDGNDLTLFQDDDGSVWAFWNRTMEPGADKARVREFGMRGARIDLATGKFLGEPVKMLDYGKLGEDWDGIGMEGSCVFKHGGRYYYFYSSWTRGYEIGYATADRLTGPWMKFAGNPIWGAQDAAACRKSGMAYTENPGNPYSHIGHNSVFTGPDGRLWLSCHGILKSDPKQVPMLMIEPIDFDSDGRVVIAPPSTEEQTVALP